LDAEYNGDCRLFLAIPKINTKRLLARNMLAKGLDPTLIAEITKLTEEELQNPTRE